jgi:hypothetical protein
MLQAVVGDDHIHLGVRRQQAAPRRRAIAPDPHRAARQRRHQHRLVAIARRIAAGRHLGGAFDGAAVTPADDARPVPAGAQRVGQPQGDRRLAAAADGDVADHDHRHRQALRLQHAEREQPATQAGENAKSRESGNRHHAAAPRPCQNPGRCAA